MKNEGIISVAVAAAAGLLGAAAFVAVSELKKRSVKRQTPVPGCSPHATPEWASWVVKVLAGARLAGRKLQDAAGLRILTLKDAELCEATMIANPGRLGRLVGWKCGATNEAALSAMGLEEAFKSPLFSEFTFWRVKAGGAPMQLQDSELQARTAEAEFAFVMGRDLPPRRRSKAAGTGAGDELWPYTEEEVWDAVADVVPALELVSSRVTQKTPETIMADGGVNAATITGEPVPRTSYHNGNPGPMVAEGARIIVNGEVRNQGSGADVMGAPITSLTWLANKLCSESAPPALRRGLRKGQLIISGAATKCTVQPGDVVRAEFDALGAVEVTIV